MTAPPSRKLVVLISGSGTNLAALISALNTPALPSTHISLVISNRKAAYGLVRAQNASISTYYLALQTYLKNNPEKTRDDYDAVIAQRVLEEEPDVIVLAGWMHVFGNGFLQLVDAKNIPVINLHPALPGAFDGAHAIERAYEALQKGEIDKTGVMVHRVIKEVDRGEPVLVRELETKKGESLELFEERLHALEWGVIVEATRMVLDQVKPLPS